MPTSGTYLWDPDLAECVDEAFERCKVDPSTLSLQHILSARRSVNFMLVEWATKDNQDFRVDRIENFALTQGTQNYTIDPDADGRIIDIQQMSLRRAGSDTTMYPMSRQEWLDIPDKDTQGRPNRFFADKRQDAVIIYLWPVPENSTDTLIFDAMRKFTDYGLGVNGPDVSYYMREAFVSGLAHHLGRKFAPEPIIPRLKLEYDEAWTNANGAQRQRGDVVIVPGSNYRRRTGGRIR